MGEEGRAGRWKDRCLSTNYIIPVLIIYLARFEYVPGRTEWRWCTSFTRSSVEWLSSGQWRVGIASRNE